MLPSRRPLQENQEVPKVQILPVETNTNQYFRLENNRMNPQIHSLCGLFHQEVQPDHQSLCLPKEHKRQQWFTNTVTRNRWGSLGHYMPWVRSVLAFLWHRRLQNGPESGQQFSTSVCGFYASLSQIWLDLNLPARFLQTNIQKKTKK